MNAVEAPIRDVCRDLLRQRIIEQKHAQQRLLRLRDQVARAVTMVEETAFALRQVADAEEAIAARPAPAGNIALLEIPAATGARLRRKIELEDRLLALDGVRARLVEEAKAAEHNLTAAEASARKAALDVMIAEDWAARLLDDPDAEFSEA